MPDETAISEAIEAFQSGEFISLAAAARAKGVAPTTVRARLAGRRPHIGGHESQQLLTETQEEELIHWILDLEKYGQAPNHHQVRAMAGWISFFSGSSFHIGKHWLLRFISRHPEIESKIGVKLDRKRAREVTDSGLEDWYHWLEEILAGKSIRREHIWNMDETGNAFGVIGNQRVVGTSGNNKATVSLPHDREWATAIECINPDGLSIRPLLIFKGESVQQQWFIPSDVPDWIFSSTKSAFTTNEIGLTWLRDIFIPETAYGLPEDEWRLLILDGHKSHITDEFMTLAYRYRIWCLYLIPHSSHILQPLDVTVFGPFKTYFRQLVSDFWQIGDLDPNRKQLFISRFEESRKLSIIRRNCSAGFKATGICPFDKTKGLENPLVLYDSSIRPTTPPRQLIPADINPKPPQTPHNSRQVKQQIHDLVLLSPSDRLVSLSGRQISKAFERQEVEIARLTMDNQALQAFYKKTKSTRKRKEAVNPSQLFINRNDIEIGSRRPDPESSEDEIEPKRSKRSAATREIAAAVRKATKTVNNPSFKRIEKRLRSIQEKLQLPEEVE